MKSHSFIYNFGIFLVLLILIIPPLFTINTNVSFFSEWNFPVQQLILFLIALLIYIFFIGVKKFSRIQILYNIFYSVFFLCVIFSFSLFVKFISTFFINDVDYNVVHPQNFVEVIFCILNFFFSAFYEETIYRIAFPKFLQLYLMMIVSKICKNEISCRKSMIINYSCEVLAILVFAFSHFYLGIFSVINAAFAQVVLRLCYKKTNSVLAGTTTHFVYNFISLFI